MAAGSLKMGGEGGGQLCGGVCVCMTVNKKRQVLLEGGDLILYFGKAYFLRYIEINEVPASTK